MSPLSLLLGVPNVKTIYKKSWPETLFQLRTFTFTPFFNVKWGYLTTKALYLLYISIIDDPKEGDNQCGGDCVIYSVCLSVILFVCKKNSKSYGQILMKFSENVYNDTRKTRFNFGGDLDH